MIAAMVSRVTGGGERPYPRDPMDRAAVVIPGKGPTYIVSWIALIFFMGLGILFVITTGQVLAFGVAFGSFALLGSRAYSTSGRVAHSKRTPWAFDFAGGTT